MYRHRTAVEVVPAAGTGAGFAAGELQLPAGERHHDEFFGDVETWRGRLLAVLPGNADAGARNVTLKIRYQSCADLGVCYPPQTRTLTVALPAAAASAAGISLPGASPGGGGSEQRRVGQEWARTGGCG